MHLTSSTIVSVAAAVTLLLAAAAVIGGQFRISRNQSILADYREAANAARMKSDALEDELTQVRSDAADKQRQIDDQARQINELRGQMKAMQDMMVGSVALETLRSHIDSARDQILAKIGGP